VWSTLTNCDKFWVYYVNFCSFLALLWFYVWGSLILIDIYLPTTSSSSWQEQNSSTSDGFARRSLSPIPVVVIPTWGASRLWIYSQDQNYWRFTDFFTKSSNRLKHASNLTVCSISPQPGHFLLFRLADVVGYALLHLRNQTANDRSQHST